MQRFVSRVSHNLRRLQVAGGGTLCLAHTGFLRFSIRTHKKKKKKNSNMTQDCFPDIFFAMLSIGRRCWSPQGRISSRRSGRRSCVLSCVFFALLFLLDYRTSHLHNLHPINLKRRRSYRAAGRRQSYRASKFLFSSRATAELQDGWPTAALKGSTADRSSKRRHCYKVAR